jgi:prephenate dehydrogenase
MPHPLRTVAIIGTGLIGGSLGLALRARRPDLRIVGYDEASEEARRAEEGGAIHTAIPSLAEAVADADLVVLAPPLAAALQLLEALPPLLRPGTLVTDVGSVKRPIVDHARRVLPSGIPFCGGHPMAGAERGGVAHADALLFENATWVLCPPDALAGDEGAFRETFAPLIGVVEATGARPLLLDAERHDRVAAAVSHLPQLLSVALVNEAAQTDEAARVLAAGGFRDMTRIASSPFALWHEILTANHGPVLDVLARFADRLQRLRYAVAAEDWDALTEAFGAARATRDTIPPRTKGFLRPLAEITVRAEDTPGALLGITRALAEAGVNVKDIELLRVREGADGVFRLGFEDEPDVERALAALAEAGFDARRHA